MFSINQRKKTVFGGKGRVETTSKNREENKS